jgi:hypothetical protein
MNYLCYNSTNFTSTTPKFFLLPSKYPKTFPDHSSVIGVKIGIVEIEFVVETSKLIRSGSRYRPAYLIRDGILKTSTANYAYDAYKMHTYGRYTLTTPAYDAYDMHAYEMPVCGRDTR